MTLPPLWPHQERTIEKALAKLPHTEELLIVSPTGSGKTRICMEIVRDYLNRGRKVEFITNRRMLAEQIIKEFGTAGFRFGRRMSGHYQDVNQNLQIATMQTLQSRVVDKGHWDHHRADLVVIDEAHIQRGKTVLAMKKERKENHGTRFLGLTATPAGLGASGWQAHIEAAKYSELIRAGRILPARVYAPMEPDLRRIGKVASSMTEDEVRSHIKLTRIIGDIEKEYWRLNPNQLPTVCYAPCVSSSRWLCEHFNGIGIPTAHIDGMAVWYGERSEKDGEPVEFTAQGEQGAENRGILREKIESGEVKIVTNRFVLREGIDIPNLYMAILATIFSGVNPYLQSVGRIMRVNGRDDHCVVMDCGGNYWRYLSPNRDREWDLGESEDDYERKLRKKQKEGTAPEPTVCRYCKKVLKDYTPGMTCPFCLKHLKRRYRRIITEKKPLVLSCRMNPPKKKSRPGQEAWNKAYWAAYHSGKTFNQARFLYKSATKSWPDIRTLEMMPTKTDSRDWNRKVRDVPRDRLRRYEND